jgi:hypothetical protein
VIQTWLIPPARNAAFVAAMEDTIAVITAPVDPARPVVCFDEHPIALRAAVHAPLPPIPGHPARVDPTYTHQGSAVRFLAVAPHLGWRQVWVLPQRRAREFALVLRALVDAWPAAAQLVLVLDNLNTHRPSALYGTFPPAEARRIWRRVEAHYTPVHGSWLNPAEAELRVLVRQCLNRQLGSLAALEREVAAWTAARNAAATPIVWSFSLADARTRLAHTYPIPDEDTIRWTDH